MPERSSAALASRAVARRSPAMVRFFGAIFAHDLSSSFHAVRLHGALPQVEGSVVLCANHPSWWDAEVFVWLAATMFAERRSFAPMEAAMLKRYGFFGRVGAFPVELGSFAAAASFLAMSEQVLGRPDGLLFVNAEGSFRDVRERPVRLLNGLAHLARRVPKTTFVPLAIELAFWNERRPNLLLRFGEPIGAAELAAMGTAKASRHLGSALEASMDTLAVAARSREAANFRTLLQGRTGVNRIYDIWRYVRAAAGGRRFDPAHEP